MDCELLAWCYAGVHPSFVQHAERAWAAYGVNVRSILQEVWVSGRTT